MKLPLARSRDIIVQNLGNEVLLYDLSIDKAYCLNEIASAIYQFCDGQASFESLEGSYGLSEDVILLTLQDLRRKNLLAEETTGDFREVSRREMIRRVGLTSAFALPVISVLVAPPAVNAASRTNCATPGTAADGASVSALGSGSGDAAAQAACFQNLNCACQSGSASGTINFCAGASSARGCTCNGTCNSNCVVVGGSVTGSPVSALGNGNGDAAAQAACLQNLNNRCCSGSATGSIGFCAGASSARSCTCNGTCN